MVVVVVQLLVVGMALLHPVDMQQQWQLWGQQLEEQVWLLHLLRLQLQQLLMEDGLLSAGAPAQSLQPVLLGL